MNDRIINPLAPDVLDPKAHAPLAGDWRDDDAQVYEADFERNDPGPAERKGLPHTADELPVCNRLLVRTVIVNGGSSAVGVVGEPVMVLPADVNRLSLSLTIFDALAPSACALTFADSRAGCYNGNVIDVPIGINNGTPLVIDLGGYTGAIWVAPIGSTDGGNHSFTAFAVTK